MPRQLMRAFIDAVMPPGSIWTPEDQADLDNLLEGEASSFESVRAFLAQLSFIRDPFKTQILSDLEREYGFPLDLTLTEQERRTRLANLVYGSSGTGTEDDMQDALDAAGFNVLVHQNDPAVDPAPFLETGFQMVCGGLNAYAGRADAYAGSTAGNELLVNGSIGTTSKLFKLTAGSGVYAGDGSTAGEFDDLIITEVVYPVPDDPNSWPFIFFVGGAATRNSGADLILDPATRFIKIRNRWRNVPTGSAWVDDFSLKSRNTTTELLTNPGFEDGGGAFTDWLQQNAVDDVVVFHSGLHSARLDSVGAPLDGPSRFIAVDPSIDYNFSVWHKVNHTSGEFAIFIDEYSDLVTQIGANKIVAITGTQDWTQTALSIGFAGNIGKIDSIAQGEVPASRKNEFKSLILQRKPLHTWAGLVINHT